MRYFPVDIDKVLYENKITRKVTRPKRKRGDIQVEHYETTPRKKNPLDSFKEFVKNIKC